MVCFDAETKIQLLSNKDQMFSSVHIKINQLLFGESQKGMLIGKGGKAIKKLGKNAREKLRTSWIKKSTSTCM